MADLIRNARQDSDLRLDYGDAIQVGRVCGGRIGKKPRPYVLTYYPEGDADRGRWFLTLHRSEIEQIAEGVIVSLSMYCCTSADCRSAFREADGSCTHCDWEPDPDHAHLGIEAAMPRLHRLGIRDVTLASTVDDVVRSLGQPTESGGGQQHEVLGHLGPWIKYHRPECQLRFEFGRQGRVAMVTFLPPHWRPGE